MKMSDGDEFRVPSGLDANWLYFKQRCRNEPTNELSGTSTPFLSAVENAKKNVPAEWLPQISAYYNLSSDEHAALVEAKGTA